MGNELKLSLENFQSISGGELVFHAGTNVIIGQSNSGKTATFRALKACLTNPSGSQRFIKKGTSKAVVTLEYEGNQIIWKRTPKESSYTINGEDFIKTGKSNAFKLLEDTGFVLENDTLMNLEEELQLPFPFGIPKSELFKLYESVFCISDSAIILKSAKEKEDHTKNNITMLDSEIIKNNNKLSEVQKFKSEVDIELLKEKRNLFKEKLKRTLFLQDGLDLIHKAERAGGMKVPEVSFENKVSQLADLKSLKKEIIRLKHLHHISKELKCLPVPKQVDLTGYKELKELKGVYETLSKLEGFEILEKEFISKLQHYVDLKSLQKVCSTLTELKDFKVPEEIFTDKLQDYNNLKDFASSLKLLKNQIKANKEKLSKIENLLHEKEKELEKFKVCPLCHKPLD